MLFVLFLWGVAVERQRFSSDWEHDPTFKRTPKNLAEGKQMDNYCFQSETPASTSPAYL